MIDAILTVIAYLAMVTTVIVVFASLVAVILGLLVFSVFRTPRQELPYPHEHVGDDE